MLMLRKRREFVRANQQARKIHQPGFVLQILPHESPDHVRVGFTATKRIGSACVRNRAKRRLRAIWREATGKHESTYFGHDFVLIAKPITPNITYHKLLGSLRYSLKKALQQQREQLAQSIT